MAKHFISVLGTNNYEPVCYEGQAITSFVQIALLEKFHDDLSKNDSSITILLTEKARKKNWEDRDYEPPEISTINKWSESIRPDTTIEKKGLLSELKEKLPDIAGKVNAVSIPDGKSKEEIWEIFQKLYAEINERDEIIFDITHSFRSIPMLAMTVINYAGVTKNCELTGIYYGAFEAGYEDKGGIRHVPIFDLGIYNEILQWAYAADTLKRDGNPREINRIFRAREKNMTKTERKHWHPIREYTEALTTLAESLNTCRGVKLDSEDKNEGDSAKRSIYSAYQNVKEKQRNAAAVRDELKETEPLYELLEETEDSFSEFDTDKNYELGMAAVRWYINNDMIQQGYTALEETAKTFLCYHYGLDETIKETRDDIIGKAANKINKLCRDEQKKAEDISESDRNKIWQSYVEDHEGQKDNNCRENSEQEDTAVKFHEVIQSLPASYAGLMGKIKDVRNDINHFGMRKKQLASDTLKKNLNKYYTELSKEIQKMRE